MRLIETLHERNVRRVRETSRDTFQFSFFFPVSSIIPMTRRRQVGPFLA